MMMMMKAVRHQTAVDVGERESLGDGVQRQAKLSSSELSFGEGSSVTIEGGRDHSKGIEGPSVEEHALARKPVSQPA